VDCSAAWSLLESERPIDAGALDRANRHLEGCAACQARLAREALAPGQVERFCAPPTLAARVGAALDGADRAAPLVERRTAWRRLAALAAAFLVGAVLAAGYATRLTRPEPGDRLAEQAVSGHIGAQLAGRAVQIASSDQHTVKPWFAGRLDLSPPVRDLAGEGFPLVGARLDYLARRPAAVLVYRHRLHGIDLFVQPASGLGPPAGARSDRGYNVLSWSSGGFDFLAVSDLNTADLGRFRDLIAPR
jgi:anti-sigma factor RsiW